MHVRLRFTKAWHQTQTVEHTYMHNAYAVHYSNVNILVVQVLYNTNFCLSPMAVIGKEKGKILVRMKSILLI